MLGIHAKCTNFVLSVLLTRNQRQNTICTVADSLSLSLNKASQDLGKRQAIKVLHVYYLLFDSLGLIVEQDN